jgi:hypothetical protein
MEWHISTSSLGGVQERNMSVSVMMIQIKEFTVNLLWLLLYISQNLYVHKDNFALILYIL